MDCRQNQRRRYEQSLITKGQEQLLQKLRQIRGVTSVSLNSSGAYSRNSDNEFLDVVYVSLVQVDNGIQSKVFEACPTVYRSKLNGSTMELHVSHASYIYAQNTLLSRLRENRYGAVELLLCLIFLLLILKLVLY